MMLRFEWSRYEKACRIEQTTLYSIFGLWLMGYALKEIEIYQAFVFVFLSQPPSHFFFFRGLVVFGGVC